ncbi:MAG: cyclohexyl-isocyanide hydratase [Sphingomonadales bacterium]|jgi:cyclohexyl-isocyanide hydratase|nr:cyclohexyl-isocyanide hydratase [Sphingomonadales bacterium]MEA3044094.1 cyclohexyl-isocyanide hydratase [Sphingomonadales bacterium]
MEPISVAFLVYPHVTQLDFTGPAQFLSRLGRTKVDYVWKSRDPVPTDAGFSVLPTATFDEVTRADIICVPGGIACIEMMEDDEVLGWVRAVGESAQWVTSVCTGSLILGAAGLLDGYRAACHWAWRDHLRLFGAEPVAERVVFDRNRVTGGGVTAGIDFALALTAAIRGEDHARLIQLALEYDPAPPFDSGSPERAGAELMASYRERMESLAPGRDVRIRAAAARNGFGPAAG